jgi:hypothetical protein
MSIPKSDARSNTRLAARYAAAVAVTSIAAQAFREAMDRIAYGEWSGGIAARFALSSISTGLIWLIFVLIILKVGVHRTDTPTSVSDRSDHSPRSIEDVKSAALIAAVLAITASFALTANDEIFYSRLLPWIHPLIWVQEVGFRVASRLFPCRMEGSSLGCEDYKSLPAFLISNTVAYLPFLLAGRLVYRRFPRVRRRMAHIFHSFIRCGSVSCFIGLSFWLLLKTLAPELSLPTHAWDIARAGWNLLNETTGALALTLALLTPFCLFNTFRAIWNRTDVLPGLSDLTWLVSFAVAALIIAYPHDVGWHLNLNSN